MENTRNIKQSYLSFKLHNELFAVSAFKVLEVLEKQPITIVPNAPDYIMGIINFRGDVLPVIEGRKKFRMPDREENAKYVIIVLEININNDKFQLGAMADGVKDVIEISESDLKEVPKMGSNYNTDFIHGVLHTDKGFIMVLDVDKIFSLEEVEVLSSTVD